MILVAATVAIAGAAAVGLRRVVGAAPAGSPGKRGEGGAPEDPVVARFGATCRSIGLLPRTRQPKVLDGVAARFRGRPTSFGRSVRGGATVGVRLAVTGSRQGIPVTQVWAGPVAADVQALPAGVFAAVGALLGQTDVRSGDAALDPVVRLVGEEARVLAGLDHPARAALLALLAQPRGRVERGWVLVDLPGHDPDKDALVAATRAAGEAARALRKAAVGPVPSRLAGTARNDPDAAVRARCAEVLAALPPDLRGAAWHEQLAALAATADPAVVLPAALALRDLPRAMGAAHDGPGGQRVATALLAALDAGGGPDAAAWAPWASGRLAAGEVDAAAAADLLGRHAPVALLAEVGRLAEDAALPAAARRAARSAASAIRARTDPAELGRLALADPEGPDGRVALAGAAGALGVASSGVAAPPVVGSPAREPAGRG